MRGGRVVQKLFLDGVPVEPGDRGQAAGDGSPCSSAGFELAREGLDIRAADREQQQGPASAPAGELPQVECVSLAGQPAVPGLLPREREPLQIGEHRLNGNEGS
jgi:hypothetical protein